MKYQIYKPNAKNEGCAAGFSLVEGQDGAPVLYINVVLQSGWDNSKKTGSFSANAKNPQKSGNFKMNANEAGEILSAFKHRVPANFFHKFNEDTTMIRFTPWDKKKTIKGARGDEEVTYPAFGMSISKNSSANFRLAMEAGETEVLSVLLSEFIARELEYQTSKQKQYQSNNQKPSNGSRASKPVDEEVDKEDDENDVPF